MRLKRIEALIATASLACLLAYPVAPACGHAVAPAGEPAWPAVAAGEACDGVGTDGAAASPHTAATDRLAATPAGGPARLNAGATFFDWLLGEASPEQGDDPASAPGPVVIEDDGTPLAGGVSGLGGSSGLPDDALPAGAPPGAADGSRAPHVADAPEGQGAANVSAALDFSGATGVSHAVAGAEPAALYDGDVAAGGIIEDAARRYATWSCAGMFADVLRQGCTQVDGMDGLGYSVEQVKAVLHALAYNPEYYYMEPSSCTIWSSNLTGEVAKVELSYVVDPADLDAYRARVEERVAEALSWTSDAMTDAQKCLALHDYLVRTIVYSEAVRDGGSDRHEPYNVVGALVERSCVCDGYSKAYVLLLGRLGIEAQVVSSLEMSHSWAMVRLDGQWYHVDVTWDDPSPDGGYSADPSRTYFLRGDDAMRTVGDQLHDGWATDGEMLYTQWWSAVLETGAVPEDRTATPVAPADYSAQQGGPDQDGTYPGGVDLAYPAVYDGPARPLATIADGWLTVPDGFTENGRTYWVEGGSVARGWREIDGVRRYFNEATGVMARDCLVALDGRVFCFDEDGALAAGERKLRWWWYWFDPSGGAMAVDAFIVLPDGRTVYYDDQGHMVYGEHRTSDGAWRCFDTGNGDMIREKFIRYGEDEHVCYYDADGARVYGSQWIGGREMWFDPETGYLDEAGRALLVWN